MSKDTRADSSGGPVRHRLPDLVEFCAQIFRKAGLSEEAAQLVADSLVDAEARGIRSHGLQRVRIYSERLTAGLLNASGKPSVVGGTSTFALVDADNAIGQVGALAGLNVALDAADEHGVGVAGVRNSNHCGSLGYFARRATDRGFIQISATNAPSTMVYFGSRRRAVGTNPLCIGVPCGEDSSFILDMASSAVARGKIIVAAEDGVPIPEGYAVDEDGKPTTDPRAALAGSVVPFAGAKGSGLAMMIDLLCGSLLGGPTGDQIGDMYDDWTRPQSVGHLFIVLKPGSWVNAQDFADATAEFARTVSELEPAVGVNHVMYPGELEEAKFQQAKIEGLAIAPSTLSELDALASGFGISERLETFAG